MPILAATPLLSPGIAWALVVIFALLIFPYERFRGIAAAELALSKKAGDVLILEEVTTEAGPAPLDHRHAVRLTNVVPEAAPAVKSEADRAFERIAEEFIVSYPAYVPVDATQLGDHRFDHLLDQARAPPRRRDRPAARGPAPTCESA